MIVIADSDSIELKAIAQISLRGGGSLEGKWSRQDCVRSFPTDHFYLQQRELTLPLAATVGSSGGGGFGNYLVPTSPVFCLPKKLSVGTALLESSSYIPNAVHRVINDRPGAAEQNCIWLMGAADETKNDSLS